MNRFILLLALAGCGVTSDSDSLESTEQAVTGFSTAPVNYYYYQAGVYWFQDSYSHKWCSNATTETSVWDYNTTCDWYLWNTNYTAYCRSGAVYVTNYYHYHCE